MQLGRVSRATSISRLKKFVALEDIQHRQLATPMPQNLACVEPHGPLAAGPDVSCRVASVNMETCSKIQGLKHGIWGPDAPAPGAPYLTPS